MKEYKLTLEEANARMAENGGDLDLRGTKITSLPDNLTVGRSLYLSGTKITSLPGSLTVDGDLCLSSSQITSLPDDLTVGGSLYLRYTQITSLPDNLTVSGGLYLSYTQITSLPDNLTVGSWLDLRGTKITSLPDNLTVGDSLCLSSSQITSLPDDLTVGGSLYLNGTKITSLPDNLTVGGSLYLNGTKITSLPDNLTVGGSLDLRGTKITSLPDNLTVGGSLDLRGTKITAAEERKVRRLQDGDYVEGRYIYADGILTHVKGRRTIREATGRLAGATPQDLPRVAATRPEAVEQPTNNGYTFHIGKIKGKNVVSDGKNYAHCDKLRNGIADLMFKTAKDRGAEQYKELTLDSMVTLEKAVEMYRVITGACRQGSEAFVKSLGDAVKDTYTVRECIELTRGQYGAGAFERFWGET